MKNKIMPLIAVILICAALSACAGNSSQRKLKRFFGEETFRETEHICTEEDRAIAQDFLLKIDEAFSDIETYDRDAAEKRHGALAHYCFCNSDVTSETHLIELITAGTNGDSGYVWIKYLQRGYGSDGNEITGSGSQSEMVYSRIEISNINGTWTAVSVKEHP